MKKNSRGMGLGPFGMVGPGDVMQNCRMMY